MTLRELRARFTVGATFTCLENTRRPSMDGQRRIVEKVQATKVWWTVAPRQTDAGVRGYNDLPKARDIIETDGSTITYRFTDEGHTLTLLLPPAT